VALDAGSVCPFCKTKIVIDALQMPSLAVEAGGSVVVEAGARVVIGKGIVIESDPGSDGRLIIESEPTPGPARRAPDRRAERAPRRRGTLHRQGSEAGADHPDADPPGDQWRRSCCLAGEPGSDARSTGAAGPPCGGAPRRSATQCGLSKHASPARTAGRRRRERGRKRKTEIMAIPAAALRDESRRQRSSPEPARWRMLTARSAARVFPVRISTSRAWEISARTSPGGSTRMVISGSRDVVRAQARAFARAQIVASA
jgi:hypothetical protein